MSDHASNEREHSEMDRKVFTWMGSIEEAPYCDSYEETKQEKANVVDASISALKTIPAPVPKMIPAPEHGKGAYWIPDSGGGPWSLRVPVPTVRGTG
ncbi:hypothetical protein V490_07562 [Pseudogymnoascus sp. VKM F-3557]|nr:hypothetical protein V490_07562 [Pseudogymnoascus sp. VKM F-3557]